MSNFILTGLFTEGSTDVRFLDGVIKKTLDELAFKCSGDVETDLIPIEISKVNLGFNEQVLNAAKIAKDKGVEILFVHVDADDISDNSAFETKIIPAKNKLNLIDNNTVCKNIVAVIPIYMTESWMLADKELLKSEIEIAESDINLGIHKRPEEINNPKLVIESIIRKSKETQTKRNRKRGLEISDLYQIIGLKLELTELEKLPSYMKFKNSLQEVLIELNFLHV